MKSEMIDVTVALRIYDVDTFVRAAQAHAVATECVRDLAEAQEHYTADKLRDCATMLIDPGKSPPGCEILYSSTESVGPDDPL